MGRAVLFLFFNARGFADLLIRPGFNMWPAALPHMKRVTLCPKARCTGFLLHDVNRGGHFLPVEPGLVHVEDLLRVVALFDDLLPLLGVFRSFFRIFRCLLSMENGTRQPKPFLETVELLFVAIETFECHLSFCRLFLFDININSKLMVERSCLLPDYVAIKGEVLNRSP